MKTQADDDKSLFLKPTEAAALLRCAKSKAYELIQTGEIPAIRIGGMIRVPRQALDELAKKALTPGGAQAE